MPEPIHDNRLQIALLLFVGMAAVIGAVLAFQHIGGYIPCKLCLAQRQPYYLAMPLAAIAALGAWQRWPDILVRALFALTALVLLYSTYLAVFHAGVEWQFWAGPTDCGATSGNISSNVGDLLGDLSATRPPSCDVAAGRFLGLSFAGWNVLASAGLALVALWGASLTRQRRA
jgi:disulfide bond formation protein DsbB